MSQEQEKPLPSLAVLGFKVLRETMEIHGLHIRLLLFRAHKDLNGYRNKLEQRQPFPLHREQPIPPILKGLRFLKAILVQQVLKSRRVRKIQLALLGVQDLRVPPVRREWRRQYRALQGLKDLRD